jgi:hypothetical protein
VPINWVGIVGLLTHYFIEENLLVRKRVDGHQEVKYDGPVHAANRALRQYFVEVRRFLVRVKNLESFCQPKDNQVEKCNRE